MRNRRDRAGVFLGSGSTGGGWLENGIDFVPHGILDCLPDVVQCVSDIIQDGTSRRFVVAALCGARQSGEQQKHARETAEEIKSHFCVFLKVRKVPP